MSASLRAAVPRQAAFAATKPKAPPARSLHMTGPQNMPSSYLAFQTKVAELGQSSKQNSRTGKKTGGAAVATTSPPAPSQRAFNTIRALQRRGDSSPIDMCYFPTRDPPEQLDAVLPRIPLIPLTPTATRPAKLSDLQHGEAVPPAFEGEGANQRLISTSSGVGVDEGIVQPMSEIDNASSAVVDAGIPPSSADKAKGEVREFLDGVFDDIFGQKRKAA